MSKTKVEIRADGLHISGYVNVTGKMSRPVLTSQRQKVIEVIDERAHQRAIEKAGNVPLTLDHDDSKILAQTSDQTLELHEDAIGLRAETVITDPETIQAAKAGKLRGWSFGMKRIVDSIEDRAGDLPIRHVKEYLLDHVSLIMKKNPCYSATSIELRGDDDEPNEIEIRAIGDEGSEVKDFTNQEPNYVLYQNKINQLRANI